VDGSARLTPVPASLPSAPVSTVREQVAQVDDDKPKPKRRNAAQPIPSTGLQPRTVAQAAADAAAVDTPPGDQLIDPRSPQMKKLHACLNDAGLGERDLGLGYISTVLARDVTSSKEITVAEAARVIDALEQPPFNPADVAS